MCDDSNPLEHPHNEPPSAHREDGAHDSTGCKNPNCPNRQRCPAANRLLAETASSTSAQGE
jgi:hypothetical protein